MPVQLVEPLAFGRSGAVAPSRVLFGPHVTNLGDDDRRLTARHTAYYERRARAGCGIVVVEGASVHTSDWPYERAPLAARCEEGWAAIVAACRPHGTLVIASLDHAGGQGSSAYSQRELWAPSRVPEVNSREVPKWMEADDIAALVDGFGTATANAVRAGCDGVEINAGQHSVVRQFLSGLTNHRDDEWGTDRLRMAREVLAAVRREAGAAIVGLRLCADELAPWAGITPDAAPAIAADLVAAGDVDYLVVVRGSIYSVEKTRADVHEPTGYNLAVTREVRAAVGAGVRVVLQGSVVDVDMAEAALADGTCDAVEMTRAQIADPDLVTKVRAGTPERVRPCIRCNQTCQARDARNPIVTCVGEPSSGHELDDPDWVAPATAVRRVRIVGGGPAGLEAARIAATRGHRVELVDRASVWGGIAAVAGPGRSLVGWLVAECRRLGVGLHPDTEHRPGDAPDAVVVQCTGSQRGDRTYEVAEDAMPVFDVVDVRRGAALPDGPIVVHDPIGGPIGVAVAEELADRATIVTPDHIAGNELARSGDLAPANVRLQQRGVTILRRGILRVVGADAVEVEDRFSGERRTLPAVAVVDCGFRLPTPPLPDATHAAGDCVAPRTLLEAVLEGRRVARAI